MLDLPPNLVQAVSTESAVLFLGAGASYGATHPKGVKIPSGEALRDLISDRFLGGQLKGKPLSEVAELAASESSLTNLQSFIKDIFKEYGPAEFHKLIPTFRWHGIASTNFDMIVEKVYDPSNSPAQQLVSFVKNGQPVETAMKRATDGVQQLKLHGSLDYHLDSEVPLILATEQYVRYKTNRTRLFERLQDWGTEFPIIFCGYSISDPNVLNVLFDLFDTGRRRPAYYVVTPNISDIEARYWSSHRIFPIKATFEAFLVALDGAVSSVARKVPAKTGGGSSTLRRHYRVANVVESPALNAFLQTDVTHVFPGMPTESADPKQFYRGFDVGWGAMSQNLDVPRSTTDALIVEGVLIAEIERQSNADLIVVKGAAGNGKTICLKRAAWSAAHDYEKICLFARDGATLRIDVIEEIYNYVQDRIFIFIDRAALWVDEIKSLLSAANRRSVKITIITAEREAEWNIKCEALDDSVSREFAVRYLSEREIRGLLERLETHRSLGLLSEISFEDRVRAFTERAQRQLLVALHEVTLGKPFEDIIFDEYHSILSNEAQNLYIDVCSLHRFGISVRAGLISRISDISFSDFKARLFRPLEAIVHNRFDKYLSDWVYESRHQRVSEILFDRVLSNAEQRYDQLVRVMRGMNLDYSTDRSAFGQLIRGKAVADTFASQELGRKFYDIAIEISGKEAYVYQQRGIFEMDHTGGSLEKAEEYLQIASGIDENNRSIKHSLATLARRQSLAAKSSSARKQLRDVARSRLSGLTGATATLPYGFHTAAQLALDELKDVLDDIRGKSEDASTDRIIVDLSRDVEKHIADGLQKFPENEHLLALESDYRSLVEQDRRAESALRKAFNANPRLDWIAGRLSALLVVANDVEGAKTVLRKCVQENPSSKKAHFDLAQLLMKHGTIDEKPSVREHLRRSFTQGDQNYDAQFWFARETFISNDFETSSQSFSRLKDAAINPRIKNEIRGPILDEKGDIVFYTGTVTNIDDSFGFVKFVDFPARIFCHRSSVSESVWDRIERGSIIRASIAFNMKGPVINSFDEMK